MKYASRIIAVYSCKENKRCKLFYTRDVQISQTFQQQKNENIRILNF